MNKLGSQRATCTICGWVETQTLQATGHKPGSQTQTKEPTCSTQGTWTKTCTVCGKVVETGPLPTVAHQYTQNVGTTPATCTANGYTTYRCTWCNLTQNRDYKSPLGHISGYRKTVKEPTCQAEGRWQETCTRCGAETSSGTIERVTHNYTRFVEQTEATCTDPGYITYRCQWCTVTKKTMSRPALGHDYVLTTCGGNIYMGVNASRSASDLLTLSGSINRTSHTRRVFSHFNTIRVVLFVGHFAIDHEHYECNTFDYGKYYIACQDCGQYGRAYNQYDQAWLICASCYQQLVTQGFVSHICGVGVNKCSRCRSVTVILELDKPTFKR